MRKVESRESRVERGGAATRAVLLGLVLLVFATAARAASLNVSLDRTTLRVGEQAVLTLQFIDGQR